MFEVSESAPVGGSSCVLYKTVGSGVTSGMLVGLASPVGCWAVVG